MNNKIKMNFLKICGIVLLYVAIKLYNFAVSIIFSIGFIVTKLFPKFSQKFCGQEFTISRNGKKYRVLNCHYTVLDTLSTKIPFLYLIKFGAPYSQFKNVHTAICNHYKIVCNIIFVY